MFGRRQPGYSPVSRFSVSTADSACCQLTAPHRLAVRCQVRPVGDCFLADHEAWCQPGQAVPEFGILAAAGAVDFGTTRAVAGDLSRLQAAWAVTWHFVCKS